LAAAGGVMTIPSAEGFLQASSCLPCTAEEEREVVAALTREAEENVKDGDLRYLVSQRSVPSDFTRYPSPRKLAVYLFALNRSVAAALGAPAVCIMWTVAIGDFSWNPRPEACDFVRDVGSWLIESKYLGC